MRPFVQPLILRRVTLILLLCWLVPVLGTMGVSIFFAGSANKAPVKTASLPAEAAGEAEASLDAEKETAEKSPVEARTGGDGSPTGPAVETPSGQPAGEAPKAPAARSNGRTPLAAAGPQNTSSVPVPSRPRPVSGAQNVDLTLLARIIHAEARGEPIEGQVAVGAVLLNRIRNPRFPNDLWSNIFKRGEFCTVRDGQIWLEPDAAAYRAARLALNGWDPTYGALYFYNPARTTSRWIWSRPVTTRIGRHVFAR